VEVHIDDTRVPLRLDLPRFRGRLGTRDGKLRGHVACGPGPAVVGEGPPLDVGLEADVALDPDSINGIDLAIYYERECPHCRVILISGHAGAADLQAHARSAGHEYLLLTKPVTPELLLTKVLELLDHLRAPEAEDDDTVDPGARISRSGSCVSASRRRYVSAFRRKIRRF
jgi:hypothetical protein